MNESYIVFAIEGDSCNFMDGDSGYLKYKGLSWDEAVALCWISFRQSYQCVLIRQNQGAVSL